MPHVRDDKMKSFLKERLDGYKHPIEDDLWASIERELPVSSEKRPLILFRIIAAVSGAAAILALSLLFSHKNQPQPETELLTSEDRIAVVEPTAHESIPETTPKILTTQPLVFPKTEIKAVETITAQAQSRDTLPYTAPVKSENAITEPQSPEDSYAAETNRNESDQWATWLDGEPNKEKSGNNFSIAFGVNGTTSDDAYDMQNGVRFTQHGSEPIEYETNTKYDFPITAGIMLGYRLTNRFSLESGLNYTFLGASDKRTADGILDKKSSYRLHYLGIPLRGSFSIYDNSRFSIYASVGVMAEKLISGESERIFFDLDGITETKNITTDNLLWSVSGAIGFNYKINRTFALFIEPSVGYYFDDGVSIPTIRRDRPMNFNLLFGIRINLH